MSMACFVVAEAEAILLTTQAASESKDLITELSSCDEEIANRMDHPNIANWIKLYKMNNDKIKDYCGGGLQFKEARSILFQFMTAIEGNGKELNLSNFKLYASVCHRLWDSETRDKVSDALDDLQLSKKTPVDVSDCLSKVTQYGLLSFDTIEKSTRVIFLGLTFRYLRKNIGGVKAVSKNVIANVCERSNFKNAYAGILECEMSTVSEEEIVVEEIATKGSAKVLLSFSILLSVVDSFYQVYEIYDAVKQARAFYNKLENEIKPKYHDYFQHLKDGAREYNNTVVLYHKKISISIHTIAEHGTSEGSLENVKLADTVKKIKEKLIKDHVCPPRYSWIWLRFKGTGNLMNEDNRCLYSYGVGTDGNFTIDLLYQPVGPFAPY